VAFHIAEYRARENFSLVLFLLNFYIAPSWESAQSPDYYFKTLGEITEKSEPTTWAASLGCFAGNLLESSSQYRKR
jgi:hypothetical protein